MSTQEQISNPKSLQPVLSDDLAVYLDPYPGHKGNELVWDICDCGNGLYNGPSGATWRKTPRGPQMPWHFACDGNGGWWIKVSSVRRRTRQVAKAFARDRAEAPMREWLAAEANWRTDVAAWLAEEARLAALVTGFVGDIDAKIKNLAGTITVYWEFTRASYTGHDETAVLLIITTEDGKVLKFVSAGASAFGWERGDRVIITSATVKAHDNYKGQDQTTISRARITLKEN